MTIQKYKSLLLFLPSKKAACYKQKAKWGRKIGVLKCLGAFLERVPAHITSRACTEQDFRLIPASRNALDRETYPESSRKTSGTKWKEQKAVSGGRNSVRLRSLLEGRGSPFALSFSVACKIWWFGGVLEAKKLLSLLSLHSLRQKGVPNKALEFQRHVTPRDPPMC